MRAEVEREALWCDDSTANERIDILLIMVIFKYYKCYALKNTLRKLLKHSRAEIEDPPSMIHGHMILDD